MSTQIVMFVVIVMMSRVLTQADYGLVAMLLIFINISQAVSDCGISQALIRRQSRTQADCSTAFYFNVVVATLLYIILYFCAPAIALLYRQPLLVSLTRVLCVGIVIYSLGMVQTALLTSDMNFKTLAKATVPSSIISGGVGIWMAYSGYGIWSIVWYQLVRLILNVVLLWIISKWRPGLVFSTSSLKYFFSFGSRLTVGGVMQILYRDLYVALIGLFYSPSLLGLYTRANQYGSLPSSNISDILQRVAYPSLCRLQHNNERMKAAMRKFVKSVTLIVFPLMFGLSVLSTPVIVATVGEGWSYAGTLLSILCMSMMWLPVDMLNVNVLQALGRTDIFLKCEIIKKVCGVCLLMMTLPFGIEMMCWGQVVRGIADLAIDSFYVGKLLGYGFVKQLKDMIRPLAYGIIIANIAFLVACFFENEWIKILSGVLSGGTTFAILVMVSKRDMSLLRNFTQIRNNVS